MERIPSAELSPRLENGVLYWYDGDTFEVELEIDAVDEDGEAIILGDGDSVTVKFLDCHRNSVKEFAFTTFNENVVTMEFDGTATALFPAGEYTYDIYIVHSGRRVTIANECKAVVA